MNQLTQRDKSRAAASIDLHRALHLVDMPLAAGDAHRATRPEAAQMKYQRPGKLSVDYNAYCEEMEVNDRVRKTYVIARDTNRALDVMAMLAGLFSASLTALILDSAGKLKPIRTATTPPTLLLLEHLFTMLSGSQISSLAMVDYGYLYNSASSEIVQVTYFLSIGLSISISVIAIFSKPRSLGALPVKWRDGFSEDGNGKIEWIDEMQVIIRQYLRIDVLGSRLTLWFPRTSEGKQTHAPLYDTVISSLMTSAEITSVLVTHGCADLTQRLDLASRSPFAVSHGGFGDVYSGRLANGTRVAIKTSRFRVIDDQDGKHLKHMAKELHTWSKCQHPNVLGLLGLVELEGQLGMISPWVDHGSVLSYLRRRPDANRRQLCYGICDGLAYLHHIGIIHGDLKGGNVLVLDDGTPLLADFGNSVLSNRSLQFTKTTVKYSLSSRWTAPEVLDGLVVSSYSADVFSLGMTLLETISGDVPYCDLIRESAVIAAILVKKEIPARPEACIPTGIKCDDMLWSLLERCWAYEPECRPTTERVRDELFGIVNLDPFGSLELEVPVATS